jgi:hypothetical protein
MRLFVGNGTRQHQTFTYVLPGISYKIHELPIPIGEQRAIPQDLTSEEMNAIIDQHKQYGMVEASKIDATKYFCGICYSSGSPIPTAKLNQLLRLNIGVLDEKGREIRKAAAVASSQVLTTSLAEIGGSEKMDGFEFTIQQENHEANDPADQVSEGLRVVTNPGKDGPRGKNRQRAA